MRLPASIALAFLISIVSIDRPAQAMDPFIRGDVNFDAAVNIADAISVLDALFLPGAQPLQCEDSADANDDGSLNIADAVSVLAYLFTAGTPDLPPPFPNPGFDPTTTDPWDCGDDMTVLPGALVRIDAGDNSSAMEGEYVIRDQGAWQIFWQSHAGAGQVPQSVDFSTDIVLAIVRSFFNGTHCVEILAASAASVVDARVYHWLLPCSPLIFPTDVFDIVVWEGGQGVPDPLIWNVTDQDVCPLPCP